MPQQHEGQEFNFIDLFYPLTLKKVLLFNIIIGFFVFFNGLFTPFHMDDFQQIVNNTYVETISSIPMYFYKSSMLIESEASAMFHSQYRPLLNVSYTLIYSISGENPIIFHIIQLIFHIINSILIYILFSKLLNKNIAYVLSLIFLVHPLNSESVVYVANLQDVLFLFFGLAALIMLIEQKNKLLTIRNATIIVCLLLASLLFKETGIIFLALLFVYSLLFAKQNTKNIISLCTIVFILYVILRFLASFSVYLTLFPSLIQRLSMEERLISVPKIIFYYFSNFFWPDHLATWQQWSVKQVNLLDFFVPLFIVLAIFTSIISFGLFLAKKKDTLFKWYIFFFLWLLLGLVLHMQLIPLDFTVADRYFYAPIIGLLGLLGLSVESVSKKKFGSSTAKQIGYYSIATILLMLMVLTIIRNSHWESDETLYSHDVKYAGNSPMLLGNYGAMLMSKGRLEESQYYLSEAIKSDPTIASNMNYIAQLYERKGEYKKAKDIYWNTIKTNEHLIIYANILNVSYNGLARIALVDEKNILETKKLSTLVLDNFPFDHQALEYLAVAEYFLGNKQQSRIVIGKLYDNSPNGLTLQLKQLIETDKLPYPTRQKDGNITY